MNTSTAQDYSTFESMSIKTRCVLIGLFLLCLFGVLVTRDTDYTRETRVMASVIGKAPVTMSEDGEPVCVIALRMPDGTLKDVHTSFAQYSVTEVGSKWGVMVSDASRGLPMPLKDKLLFTATLVSLIVGVCLLAWAIIDCL